MDVKFEYEYEGQSYFGKIYRPIAEIFIKSPASETWTKVVAIVDTGADFSILPNHFAYDLRIDVEKDCIKSATSGVGGEQTILLYKKPLRIKLGPDEKDVPIAFFDNDEVPALMGRLGFIETFDTEFLKSRTVVFKS